MAGASEGLGEAWADALVARGVNLILIARGQSKLQATADRLVARHGCEVRTLALDLGADPSVLRERITRVVDDREVGLLVYNAARSRVGGFFASSLDEAVATLDVNCRGPLVLSYLLGSAMRERGRGGIVLMGSLAGQQGSPRLATYAATKAFDRVLGESLWGELQDVGVDVLCCVAGATRTPGFEAAASKSTQMVMEPAAVVEEALAVLGRRPSVVVGWFNKLVDAVLGLLPRRRRVLIMKGALADSGGSREDLG